MTSAVLEKLNEVKNELDLDFSVKCRELIDAITSGDEKTEKSRRMQIKSLHGLHEQVVPMVGDLQKYLLDNTSVHPDDETRPLLAVATGVGTSDQLVEEFPQVVTSALPMERNIDEPETSAEPTEPASIPESVPAADISSAVPTVPTVPFVSIAPSSPFPTDDQADHANHADHTDQSDHTDHTDHTPGEEPIEEPVVELTAEPIEEWESNYSHPDSLPDDDGAAADDSASEDSASEDNASMGDSSEKAPKDYNKSEAYRPFFLEAIYTTPNAKLSDIQRITHEMMMTTKVGGQRVGKDGDSAQTNSGVFRYKTQTQALRKKMELESLISVGDKGALTVTEKGEQLRWGKLKPKDKQNWAAGIGMLTGEETK